MHPSHADRPSPTPIVNRATVNHSNADSVARGVSAEADAVSCYPRIAAEESVILGLEMINVERRMA